MPSKITTIYNAFLSDLETIFSDKTRLANAYALDNNPHNYLRNGWGLRIDPSDLYRPVFCTSGQSRLFSVILTREVIRVDTNADIIDTAVIAILEDVNTLILEIEKSDQLSVSSSIDKIDFSSSSGIEILGASKSQFVSIEVGFIINYKENLS